MTLKAHHKGTNSSKRKKKAKLERVKRSLKKKQRNLSEGVTCSSSPLQYLHDPQVGVLRYHCPLAGSVIVFLSCTASLNRDLLRSFFLVYTHAMKGLRSVKWQSIVNDVIIWNINNQENANYQVKLMMMKVISRTIGLHRLIILNFYPFIQKYVQVFPQNFTFFARNLCIVYPHCKE